MTLHDDLPPTPPTDTDPYALDLPMFEIPNVDTLRALMQAEQHAVQVVHHKVRGFMEPGMSLVGSDGKPMVATGEKLQEKITGWLHDLLTAPTIAEEWVGAPGDLAKQCTISGASFQIAYMVYQEFGRLVNSRAPEFVQVVDAAMLLGMTALHNGHDPVEAYSRSFQAKTQDAEGNAILGQNEQFRQRLGLLKNLLLNFLVIKEMATVPAPDAPMLLTDKGRRLLNHLAAVLGSTESMRMQGPEIMKGVMADMKQGEDRSQTQVAADLNTPSSEA